MSKTMSMAARFLTICAAVTFSVLLATPVDAQLKPDFYSKSCPNLLAIVGKNVQAALNKDSRMAASLLRLHFHDCFVLGCDASILLDDDSRLPGGKGEKTANPNNNSVRGYELIDQIKAEVEKACPRAVSCADIVTLAAYASIKLSGGPVPSVPLGRRDSLTASFDGANQRLPSPSSTVSQLKQKFSDVGLNVKDLVTLSGGHTLGFSRCGVFRDRLYNFNGGGVSDPTIDGAFLASLKQTCPQNGDGNVLKNFDGTPAKFDNQYFKDLVAFRGVLSSDEVLFTQSNDTKVLVRVYAQDQDKFFTDFSASMLKMSKMNSAQNTEIRLNCRKPNSFRLEDMAPLIELVSDE